MSSEAGLRPIVEHFLHKNFLMAIEFQQGFVFGRVIRRRLCHWKPYYLISSTGTPVSIGPQTNQTELWFRDPRNPANDIPYLGSTTDVGYPWILHGSFGITPQYINAYPRFPSGKDVSGKFPNVDPTRPALGDDTGFINELNSPYLEPSDWIELVIPPIQHLGCEFYNKDLTRTFQPKLNLQFAVYWFQALTPPVYSNLIRSIAMRQVPAAFLTVGFADTPLDFGSTLQNDWQVTPMSLDDAINLGPPTPGGRVR